MVTLSVRETEFEIVSGAKHLHGAGKRGKAFENFLEYVSNARLEGTNYTKLMEERAMSRAGRNGPSINVVSEVRWQGKRWYVFYYSWGHADFFQHYAVPAEARGKQTNIGSYYKCKRASKSKCSRCGKKSNCKHSAYTWSPGFYAKKLITKLKSLWN